MNYFRNAILIFTISISLFATSLLIQTVLKMYQDDTLKNHPEIIEKLTKSAKSDNIDASFILATSYKDGKVGVVDYPNAIRWYKKAASLGDSDAMLMLGWIYYEGKSTLGTDINEAKYWFSQAASMGVDEAIEMIQILNS